MKFATKPILYYLPHPRHVGTLPWEIENQIFCRYSAHMEENANKLHFKYTIFTARRYASAVLAVIVCPSVCLSVRHKSELYKDG